MIKLFFVFSNILAVLKKQQKDRHALRMRVNTFLCYPYIAIFVKNIFNEKIISVKPVRQHAPNRCVCVVNDKYFVKIFKHMSKKRLKNFLFLNSYLRKFITVPIPNTYIAKNDHMYLTEKLSGKSIYDFDKDFVLANEDKIKKQVLNIIDEIQSIDVAQIPNAQIFWKSLEKTHENKNIKKIITKDTVLAHCDMNVRNVLFDDDLNICGLIDFDVMSLTDDKNKDINYFNKSWERYKTRVNRLESVSNG